VLLLTCYHTHGEARCRCRKVWLTRNYHYYYYICRLICFAAINVAVCRFLLLWFAAAAIMLLPSSCTFFHMYNLLSLTACKQAEEQSHPTSSHVLVLYHNSLCCRLLCAAADTMRCICLDSVTECVTVCRALLLQPCAPGCLDYHCFTARRVCCCQQSHFAANSVLTLCCLV
jgi:hypothetical protein